MPQSEYKAREMRAKTHEVYEYDHDDSKPGKPLHILIPGGLIALATLALIIFIGYQTYLEESLSQDLGNILMLVLAPFYVGGVFLFSYGYELYNIPRAIRLTAIIVFVTLAAVVIVAVLFLVLGNMKGGGSKSSSKSSSSKSKSSSGSGSLKRSSSGAGKIASPQGRDLGKGLAGGAAASMKSAPSSSRSSSGGGDMVILGGGRTRVETREVTKEVIKEVPKEPMPITCPFCTRSYVPVEYQFICPSCGAATPKDLIEESQMPKADDGR